MLMIYNAIIVIIKLIGFAFEAFMHVSTRTMFNPTMEFPMTTIKLSDAQHRVLAEAGNQPQTPAEKFAEYLPAGARGKVLAALQKNGLLEKRKDGHYITEAGFAALGKEATPVAAEAASQKKPAAEIQKTKPERATKQDTMIHMLKGGTTLQALMDATGWQKHSVHGAMANLKKKQNLTITQSKAEGADRVYKIA